MNDEFHSQGSIKTKLKEKKKSFCSTKLTKIQVGNHLKVMGFLLSTMSENEIDTHEFV
jgi:hypothetical protein